MQYTHRMIGYTNLCCNLESASDDDVCYARFCYIFIYFPIKPYTHSFRNLREMWIKYCNFYCFWCCCWNKRMKRQKAKHFHVCMYSTFYALWDIQKEKKEVRTKSFCDAFAVCKDFDVMWNEYFMSYETYKIVISPPFVTRTTRCVCFN